MSLKKLAVIDFSFLKEQSSVKGWDNMFYELFEIFNNKEKLLDPPVDSDNDHFIFVAQGFIYLKQYDQEKIHIYKNEQYKKLNEIQGQSIILMIYDDFEIEIMKEIYQTIEDYLKISRKVIKEIKVNDAANNNNSSLRIYKAFNVDNT